MKTPISLNRCLKAALTALVIAQAPVLLFTLPAQAAEQAAPSVPSSLEGYSITFDLSEAHVYVTGSTGMQHALETRFADYQQWDWQKRKLSADAIWFAKIDFSIDGWKDGKTSGLYKVEKVNPHQLFFYLYEKDDTRLAFLLLDFTDAQSGVAIWGEEDAFVGNIKFTLQKGS